MAKFQFALVLLVVAFAVLGCDAQRVKARGGNRKLARQEVEVPVTPYPTADELKPEIPFEESAPTEEPTVVEEAVPETAEETIPDDVVVVPEVAIVYNTPDEVYGPPEYDVDAVTADVFFARQRAQKARLVQARRKAAYRQAKAAKLRAAKKTSA